MKAVMYGGGNIGRGFIGALLSQSGYEVTFIDVAEPVVKALQENNELTELQVMQDEMKTMPFGDIWNEYCNRCSVKKDREWFEDIKLYEEDILSKRG